MNIAGIFAAAGKDILKVPEIIIDTAKDLVVVASDLPAVVTDLDGIAADISAAITADGLNFTADQKVAEDFLTALAKIKAFVSSTKSSAAAAS